MSETRIAPGTGADDLDMGAPGSREREAAEAAMARGARPPEALGGPPAAAPDAVAPPGAPVGAAAQPVPEVEDLPAEVTDPSRTGLAARLAAERHDGDDVEVVDDEYLEARDRLAHAPQSADEDDLEAVTEWLLSDETEVNTRKLRVRYGGSDTDPKITSWFIRAIGIDTIRSAEREAAGSRAQRRGGGSQYDELKANLRIVVEGTALPDLKAIARQKGIADATVLVERKFRYRPGAIAQLAGEVMALSGFDTEDVRAAGN